MLIAIGISLAALLAVSLAVVFLRSRRTAKNPVSDSTRRRAVMDDCGDDVVWEVGKRRSISDAKNLDVNLTKRSFLKRAAFTVSAFSVAWLASRGKAATFGSQPRSPEDRTFGKHEPTKEDHQDISDHTDAHSDGGGGGGGGDGGHSDSHGDGPGNHTDASNLSMEDRTFGKHQPTKEDHQDYADHSDEHSDGPGDGHSDAHSDAPGNHTDASNVSMEDRTFGKHQPTKEDHQDYADHGDQHSDGGGDGHGDVHSDSPGSHTDNSNI